jgi:hypothetical protein
MLSGTREKDTPKERSSSPREARSGPDRASARSGRRDSPNRLRRRPRIHGRAALLRQPILAWVSATTRDERRVAPPVRPAPFPVGRSVQF